MFSALRAIISYKNVFTYLSCELLCCKFSYTALNVICTRRYKLAMQFVTHCKRYSSMKQPKQTIIECTEDKQTIQQINKYMQIRAMAKKNNTKKDMNISNSRERSLARLSLILSNASYLKVWK